MGGGSAYQATHGDDRVGEVEERVDDGFAAGPTFSTAE
jgi:hypothetical protein